MAINWWAVIVAALASMVLGFLWYGPLFGKKWMALSGHAQGGMDKSGMSRNYVIMIVGCLVEFYVLARLGGGVSLAFWIWLGFAATKNLGAVLWERKPWSLWVLNSAYDLIGLLIGGWIIGMWM
jgi:hypothetical protein